MKWKIINLGRKFWTAEWRPAAADTPAGARGKWVEVGHKELKIKPDTSGSRQPEELWAAGGSKAAEPRVNRNIENVAVGVGNKVKGKISLVNGPGILIITYRSVRPGAL